MISSTTNDVSLAVDKQVMTFAESLPTPADRLVRRLGAVSVEVLHQSGRVAVVAVEVAEGITKVVVTGISTIEGQTEAALKSGIDTARNVGSASVGIARDAAKDVADTVSSATRRVERKAEPAADEVERRLRVVAGTADRVSDDVEDAAERGAKTVAAAADDAVESSLEAGIGDTTDLDNWTKDELYERAQELDISGRSSMSKDELVAALRSA